MFFLELFFTSFYRTRQLNPSFSGLLSRCPAKTTPRLSLLATMSSHVVVLDVTARRATVKTTPGKHLTDILQEACTKLGIDASQYGLK